MEMAEDNQLAVQVSVLAFGANHLLSGVAHQDHMPFAEQQQTIVDYAQPCMQHEFTHWTGVFSTSSSVTKAVMNAQPMNVKNRILPNSQGLAVP